MEGYRQPDTTMWAAGDSGRDGGRMGIGNVVVEVVVVVDVGLPAYFFRRL